MIPTFTQIRDDEIRHVLYTGLQVDQWLKESPSLAVTFEECMAHTNRETWHDLANMSHFMADHLKEIMKVA